MIIHQTINFDIQSNDQVTHHTPARGKGEAAGPHEPTPMPVAQRPHGEADGNAGHLGASDPQ